MSSGKQKNLALVTAGLISTLALSGQSLPNRFPFPNAAGLLETYNLQKKPIDLGGPFFQSLGTNGRSCASCHRPAQGWSISADEVRIRFDFTRGLDPIFRTNDGSVCDHDIDTSTAQGRRKAYRLLIDRGLLRITLAVRENAEFNVVSVNNPYGCDDPQSLAVYRRPLPATNLRFLSTVMWDGRESSPETGTQKITFLTNPGDLMADLAHQALDATAGHAQGTTALTSQQQQAIVDFETNLVTAQAFDYRAGALHGDGVTGGPMPIATQDIPAFFVGTNDPLGGNPHGAPFTPVIFSLFDAWANQHFGYDGERDRQRARILHGQQLFNSKPIKLIGVAGLNDDPTASISGTCGTCHDSPNVGNHSVSLPVDIGVSDPESSLDVKYLPVFTLQNKTTYEIKTTTDPGRALVTGKWADIGKFKGPILRGLAARAPYFHNGSARSLRDVLDFYDQRFQIGLTPEEKRDLIAFLNSL